MSANELSKRWLTSATRFITSTDPVSLKAFTKRYSATNGSKQDKPLYGKKELRWFTKE